MRARLVIVARQAIVEARLTNGIEGVGELVETLRARARRRRVSVRARPASETLRIVRTRGALVQARLAGRRSVVVEIALAQATRRGDPVRSRWALRAADIVSTGVAFV